MTVCEWLQECDATYVSPVKVTIGKECWEGAKYTQRGKSCIYVVGGLPHREGRVCYNVEGDSRDWYVAAYWNGNTYLTEYQRKTFHPFGHNFILMSWDIVGSPIDEFEKYMRIPMIVENL